MNPIWRYKRVMPSKQPWKIPLQLVSCSFGLPLQGHAPPQRLRLVVVVLFQGHWPFRFALPVGSMRRGIRDHHGIRSPSPVCQQVQACGARGHWRVWGDLQGDPGGLGAASGPHPCAPLSIGKKASTPLRSDRLSTSLAMGSGWPSMTLDKDSQASVGYDPSHTIEEIDSEIVGICRETAQGR